VAVEGSGTGKARPRATDVPRARPFLDLTHTTGIFLRPLAEAAKNPLGRQIAFWCAMAAIWAFGAFSYVNTRVLVATNDGVEHAHEVRFQAEHLLGLLRDAETGQRGYLITGDVNFLEPYRTAVAETPIALTRLAELVADRPEQAIRLQMLQPLIEYRLLLLNENLRRRDQLGVRAIGSIDLEGGRTMMDTVRDQFAQVIEEETALAREREARAEYDALLSSLALGLGLVVSSIAIGVLFHGMQGEVRRRRMAEAQAQAINETLEQRVRKRTAQIAQAQAEAEVNAAKLAHALELADAAAESKSLFFANMSHELRTPLNAIIGFSEMMHGEVFGPLGNDRYREYILNVKNSGTHLLGMVNDILDLTRYDSGRMTLREEELDVEEAIRSALSLVEYQAAKAQLKLDAHLAVGGISCKADAKRLKQILVNLLSNAIKFTPAGGEVRIAARPTEAGLVIAVTDTGIGMSEDQIPMALERFGQIDSKLSRKYEGTGLGLPLTKCLVELHGGTLVLESQLGAGTTATVTFPPERVIRALRVA
jgi:signal transduction histidine kinase